MAKEETYAATKSDIARLKRLYKGREPLHGELHDHSGSGDPENDPWKTADGKVSIAVWPHNLKNLRVDFAALVDHRQSRHMRHEVWDNAIFIGGTETGHRRWINDVKYAMHYNILMWDVEMFESFLASFPEFHYENGYFKLKPPFEEDRFKVMCQAVMDSGAMLVHAHPAHEGYLDAEDPEEYLLAEGAGLEVFCGYYGNMSHPGNMKAYDIWVKLLNLGHRVIATSGSDSHRLSKTYSLATLYSPERDAKAYVKLVRDGDMTAGPAGIRMCIGDTCTGGYANFREQRLVIAVDDFHPLEQRRDHTYRLDVFNEQGLVCQQEFSCSKSFYFAMDAEKCRYYRANIYDVTDDYIFAVGNPIWNKP